MILVDLKGDLDQKLVVSGNIRFDCLKSKIPNQANSTKSFFFMIKKGKETKLIPMATTIKQMHDKYHDQDGYLRVYVKEESAF
jgi:hypothetical protein